MAILEKELVSRVRAIIADEYSVLKRLAFITDV